MPKIRVEIEVPENCKNCMLFDDEYRYCVLFSNPIILDVHNNIFKRCEKCRQAEVEE